MRICFTGGASLLALNWAYAMRDRHQIILFTHQRPIFLQGVQSIRGEFGSVESIQTTLQKLKPDLVINTTAMTNVDECELHPDLAYQINSEFAKRIAQATSLEKIPFIHISTDQLFDGSRSFSKETEPLSPLNIYAQTKILAESYVLDAHPDVLILRTNFFAWGHAFRNSLSDWILYSLRSSKQIEMFKDVFFTPIVVDSLVKIAHALLENGAKGIFHVTGDERISKYDFALCLAEHFGLSHDLIRPIHLADKKLVAKRPLDMSLDNHKVRLITKNSLGDLDKHIYALKSQEEKGQAEELRAAVGETI